MKNDNNVTIIVENDGNKPGFNIYLSFSGVKELLMHHRHNGLLYLLLKDGMSVGELRRWKPVDVSGARGSRRRMKGRRKSERLDSMVRHLLKCVDAYIAERKTSETLIEADVKPAYSESQISWKSADYLTQDIA